MNKIYATIAVLVLGVLAIPSCFAEKLVFNLIADYTSSMVKANDAPRYTTASWASTSAQWVAPKMVRSGAAQAQYDIALVVVDTAHDGKFSQQDVQTGKDDFLVRPATNSEIQKDRPGLLKTSAGYFETASARDLQVIAMKAHAVTVAQLEKAKFELAQVAGSDHKIIKLSTFQQANYQAKETIALPQYKQVGGQNSLQTDRVLIHF